MNDSTATVPSASGVLGFDRLAQLLGSWQTRELHAARGFPECRGLSPAQLEDLYQDTALALLSRPYASEEHLRNALRHGIRHRALNMHRDQRRRRQILAEHAPAMHRTAQARQTPPEDAALAQQDRLIAKEFLAELGPLERQVFALTAEGLRYRAIATTLDIAVNEARAAARSCERKRARFQLLYETGRLCGYRAATIQALEEGAAAGALAEQARAHLAACPACARAQVQGATEPLGGLLPLSGVFAGAAAGVWRWLGRLAGCGGITAKAGAVAITAAVVASNAIGTSGHYSRSRPRPPVFTRVPPSVGREANRARKIAAPLRQPVRPGSRPDTASADAERSTSTRQAPVIGVPRRASVPMAMRAVTAAEREFGPER